MKWRKFVQYSHLVARKTAMLLDDLEEIFPVPEKWDSGEEMDKYAAMGCWLDDAKAEGLITSKERTHARLDVGPHL